MPLKKYFVRLTPDEREQLEAVANTGTRAAYKRVHAQILLLCDQSDDGPAVSDSKVAKQVGKTVRTIENVRRRLVENGLDAALERNTREPRIPKFDGAQQARIIATACSQPPEGHAKWTLRLLAEKVVELEIVDSISKDGIRAVLKKRHCSLT
jgi:transposase